MAKWTNLYPTFDLFSQHKRYIVINTNFEHDKIYNYLEDKDLEDPMRDYLDC